jgi:hypothetical protein
MTSRVRKIPATAAFLAAAICLGLAVVHGVKPVNPTEVDPIRFTPILLIGKIPIDELHPVEVAFENLSSRPIRIVGSGDFCGLHACFTGRGLPLEIPPHERGTIVVETKGTSVGPLSEEVSIYTDVAGQGTLSIRFVGEVIEATGLVPDGPDRTLTSTNLP